MNNESRTDNGNSAPTASARGVDSDKVGIQYVYMYQGWTEGALDLLSDPSSLTARIARRRGAKMVRPLDQPTALTVDEPTGQVLATNTSTASPQNAVDRAESGSVANKYYQEYIGRIIPGPLSSPTGYFMEFVSDDLAHSDVPPHEIGGISGGVSKPVTETTLDSLPAYLLSQLEEEQYIRFKGQYNGATSRFEDVELGWGQTPSESGVVHLLELYQEFGQLTPVVDYIAIEETDHLDVEAVAEARNVQERTIEENVEAVRRTLQD